MSQDTLDTLFNRARELKAQGFDWLRAHGIAWLETRVAFWPPAWGDDLQVLIYGDFEPPDAVLQVAPLGLTVYPEKLENTVIRNARSVVKATVKVPEKSVAALIDAGKRINLFLGAHTLVWWGNAGIGWWSWITHDTGAGVVTKLGDADIPRAVDGILRLKPEIRRKVDAALYWVREPKNLLLEFPRHSVLRVYSAYWNAFECLVEAINFVKPREKIDKNRKQGLIDDFIRSRGGRLTPADVQECYQSIVNPSFVGKAIHVLSVCFGDQAKYYIDECFRMPDRDNRLYEIRNAINHGDIDAENPEELVRVEARLSRLFMIIWRMFGLLVPFPAPLDSELPGQTKHSVP